LGTVFSLPLQRVDFSSSHHPARLKTGTHFSGSCFTNVVALAVKAANSDVPPVFAFGLDPAETGLVDNAFARPQVALGFQFRETKK
jgi:hypothetical protein